MIPKLSFTESLTFNMLYSFPNYLQGLFTRRRFWVGFWSKIQIDRLAVRFVSGLRARYGSGYFFTRVGGSTALLVLDHGGIHHILSNSPSMYGDAASKHRGMSHFQPGAVTISRGKEWKDRRRFNQVVLETGRHHSQSDRFLGEIVAATTATCAKAGDQLQWQHFDELFKDIASGIIFGRTSETVGPLFERLGLLMRESNRVFGLRKSKHFDSFYAELKKQLDSPAPGSLVEMCAQAPSTERTRAVNQIPHWMFALRETLAINTARALALLVSHPDKEARAKRELASAGSVTTETIHRLKYLEGCVQEAMRLWPSTPFIAREALAEEVIAGSAILPTTQVLILNTFNHRDRESDAYADSFFPDQWLDGIPDRPFNHLSGGPQACAGRDVALFVATAVLATLLQKGSYSLERPSLDLLKPLPSMFNHFRLSLRKR